MRRKIYYAKPSITEEDVRAVCEAARDGWGDRCYEQINQFEVEFAKFIGARYALATSSATGAMYLSLLALGIGQGDEVIIADTNWIASVAPVVHVGATPVFVDIRPDTWCIDSSIIENHINDNTKAIIAVHLYGNLCEMDKLESIAKKYNLFIIEDAAEAFGSRWGDVYAGTRGEVGIFSFHGTKTITTGEGGMAVTNDENLFMRMSILNNHGRIQGDKRQFWSTYIGMKFKMSNIQAALGLSQLRRANELIERRREIFFNYAEYLKNNNKLIMNPIPNKDEVFCYWMPSVVFSKQSKIRATDILDLFRNNNIDGRRFFSPLSMQANFKNSNTPVAHDIAQRAINLPSYHEIADEEIQFVCKLINQL